MELPVNAKGDDAFNMKKRRQDRAAIHRPLHALFFKPYKLDAPLNLAILVNAI
jgi:hypothetical protein